MNLYLVGRYLFEGKNSWEFAGIFSTEQIAIDNCFDATYFLARVKLDEQIPVEPSDFEYAYYPKA